MAPKQEVEIMEECINLLHIYIDHRIITGSLSPPALIAEHKRLEISHASRFNETVEKIVS